MIIIPYFSSTLLECRESASICKLIFNISSLVTPCGRSDFPFFSSLHYFIRRLKWHHYHQIRRLRLFHPLFKRSPKDFVNKSDKHDHLIL